MIFCFKESWRKVWQKGLMLEWCVRGLSHSFDIQFARKSNIASIFSLLLQTNDIFLTRNSIYLAACYSSPELWRNLFIKSKELLVNDLSATFLANFYITFYSKYFYQQWSQGKKKVFWFAWKLQYEQAFQNNKFGHFPMKYKEVLVGTSSTILPISKKVSDKKSIICLKFGKKFKLQKNVYQILLQAFILDSRF